MHVLVLYCHPVETSFHASLHAEVLKRFLGRVGQAMARFA